MGRSFEDVRSPERRGVVKYDDLRKKTSRFQNSAWKSLGARISVHSWILILQNPEAVRDNDERFRVRKVPQNGKFPMHHEESQNSEASSTLLLAEHIILNFPSPLPTFHFSVPPPAHSLLLLQQQFFASSSSSPFQCAPLQSVSIHTNKPFVSVYCACSSPLVLREHI